MIEIVEERPMNEPSALMEQIQRRTRLIDKGEGRSLLVCSWILRESEEHLRSMEFNENEIYLSVQLHRNRVS